MKRTILFTGLLGISFVFAACGQNEQLLEYEKEMVTRITFKDASDFINTFNELSKEGYDKQLEWAKGHSSSPLLPYVDNCQDSEMQKMPTAFQALFDKQLEVQINDSILKYINGELFWVSDGGNILCGDASATFLDEQPSTRTQTDVTFGKLGLNHQFSFVPVNYKDYYTFKYVHELKSVHVRVNNENAEALFLALKLEYKGSSWHEAGESRTVIFQLSGSASVPGNYGMNINELNHAFTFNVQKNYDYLLGPAFIIYNGMNVPNRFWSVNLKGTITHWMVGYPETKWVDVW